LSIHIIIWVFSHDHVSNKVKVTAIKLTNNQVNYNENANCLR
jgi:hypothetical protein